MDFGKKKVLSNYQYVLNTGAFESLRGVSPFFSAQEKSNAVIHILKLQTGEENSSI